MATKRLIDLPRVLLAGVALAVAGAGDTQPRPVAAGPTVQPHAVVPRGPLSADERNTIAVFESVSPSVVLHHHRAARPRLLQPQRHARAARHGLGFHLGRAGPRRHEFSRDPRRAGGARQARRSAQLSGAARRCEPRARSRRAADRRRRPTCPRRLRSAAARSCASAKPCSRSAIRSASITR